MKAETRTPCKSCPFLKSAPLALWDPREYMMLADNERTETSSPKGFACHKGRSKHPSLREHCIGWILDQKRKNIPSLALRISMLHSEEHVRQVEEAHCNEPLFESIEALVKANLAADRRLNPQRYRDDTVTEQEEFNEYVHTVLNAFVFGDDYHIDPRDSPMATEIDKVITEALRRDSNEDETIEKLSGLLMELAEDRGLNPDAVDPSWVGHTVYRCYGWKYNIESMRTMSELILGLVEEKDIARLEEVLAMLNPSKMESSLMILVLILTHPDHLDRVDLVQRKLFYVRAQRAFEERDGLPLESLLAPGKSTT